MIRALPEPVAKVAAHPERLASVTSILRDKEFVRFLKSHILRPRVEQVTIRAQRQCVSSRACQVGTAFDYLLRFGLESRHLGQNKRLYAETLLSSATKDSADDMQSVINEARTALRTIRTDAPLSTEAAQAAMKLALIDVRGRSARDNSPYHFSGSTLSCNPEELDDLKNLFALVPWQSFTVQRRALLNPSFKQAQLVGGADADLVLDDTIVEIKTVAPQVSLQIAWVRQLVAYALLANSGGFDLDTDTIPITRLAVYFSRAGELRYFQLSDCISPGSAPIVLEKLLSFHSSSVE